MAKGTMEEKEEKPKVLFDPDDRSAVQVTKVGVWEYYEDISGTKGFAPKISLESNALTDLYRGRFFIMRMVYDIALVEGGLFYLVSFLLLKLLSSFIPALGLWYTSEFLKMVEVAMEERKVDKDALFRIGAGRVITAFMQQVLLDSVTFLGDRFNRRVRDGFALRHFQLSARLDIPTYHDKLHQLHSLQYGYRSVWAVFETAISAISTAVNLVAHTAVLYRVLNGHKEMRFLLISGFVHIALEVITTIAETDAQGVHAVKCNHDVYIHTRGLEDMIQDMDYRREIVASGLGSFIAHKYEQLMNSLLGVELGVNTRNRHNMGWRPWLLRFSVYARNPVDSLSQIYTCLQVVDSVSSAPFSLATLQLVNSTVSAISDKLFSLRSDLESVSERVQDIREYYQLLETPNKIADGSIPFPENQRDISQGISVEFKNVSFAYPHAPEKKVLEGVSFKIEQGQLCVIVGENGSGKSTILTLMTRIYDITEGEILLNGIDIRKLKLADVRSAISVLFQDYTLYPLSIAQNIGYGDIGNLEDTEKIQEAAKLGGADEFIEALPHKYGTYVDTPVWEYSTDSHPARGSKFADKDIDFSKLKLNDRRQDLSGGQKQRIALSRTFMRSIVSSDSPVGLLLFDEPSASLDPKAENDLFTRLRDLRGSKTMVFSSHRFGKLTRHADLILYISKGQVAEAGNHNQLLKQDGEYAKFWNLQVQDFLL
ncbi:hypothetical protein D9611_005204 [Ephemerocybe angulata]|uniref:ABC transporter domain-containing protein n=1 Tax=Ephemerocybe angulata TaxID=980116 RepID=A0A8H5FDD0_9AGAR|nr:hypothetical protein D9611_005204 [Tulosesus angulatus]